METKFYFSPDSFFEISIQHLYCSIYVNLCEKFSIIIVLEETVYDLCNINIQIITTTIRIVGSIVVNISLNICRPNFSWKVIAGFAYDKKIITNTKFIREMDIQALK